MKESTLKFREYCINVFNDTLTVNQTVKAIELLDCVIADIDSDNEKTTEYFPDELKKMLGDDYTTIIKKFVFDGIDDNKLNLMRMECFYVFDEKMIPISYEDLLVALTTNIHTGKAYGEVITDIKENVYIKYVANHFAVIEYNLKKKKI